RRSVLLAPGSGVRGLRTARLLDSVPIVLAGLAEEVPVDLGGLTLVACQSSPRSTDSALRLRWELPAITVGQRQRLWSGISADAPPSAIADWELTPAEVVAAVSAGNSATRFLSARLRAGSLATMHRMQLPYTWDDLVVPTHVAEALQRLVTHVRLRHEVLDGWEFRRLVPSTAGVTALFAGPSGTGKTMATQVLARDLGLELFRIDLASVVSKYIGETEKQLAMVFDEAERSRMLVLFDEADALFGQRTRVQDAHDRYANIEIDYLLQRLDSFSGVAVLATNRKSDLDAAFLRRLSTVVDFVSPAPAERLLLWKAALPSHTSAGAPVTDGVDHRWLATHIDLTGAEIKTISLSAAFEARGSGGLITQEGVLDASRRELGKRGAVLRLPLGDPRAEVAS
ncbi:MAG: ATP-binding protein, partial [Micropruina sp.]